MLAQLESTTQYFCSPDEQNQVTADQISNVKEMHWNTFDQFKKRAFGVWIVELPIEPSEGREGSCTCPEYLKKYICKQ